MNARLPLLAALLGAATVTTQAQSLNTAKLDSLLTSLAANNKMMGSLAVSRAGQVVYSHAFGSAQLAPNVPATPATRYRMGSISKMFTAVMIFQLIEEKKLTLDTKLATFFPQLPNAKTITINQLLSHRSGLHSITDDEAYLGYLTQPKTQAELLAMMAKYQPDFEPGTQFKYSNSGYIVLGYIVEKLGKQPYAQALQKRVAAKAGLKNTYYGGKIDPAKQEALSYKPGPDGWVPDTETDMSIPGGAGAVVSTPADLDRFLEALFGGKLVSAASLAQMQTFQDKQPFGRGLMRIPFNGKQAFGHGGTIDGFQSSAGYFPDDKLAVTLSTNAHRYALNDAMIGVLNICFNRPYKIPDFAAPAYVPTAADLDRYAGTYASPSLPLKITFTKDGTTLMSQATGQSAFALEPVSRGVFKFDPAGIRAEFAADKPMFTLKQGGREFVFTKE
ncbi:MAG TPA: serine hydrolase domain-containing protein [Hymenobacter sp.]|uniref:serine hydrolase domain-containing protein n=1 Tax=Hymenobacter sp. TaxID=1898978 RepID=UPI002D7E3ECD|nr:serine hydrolase domain-containing protein [Hymenobacter sp.]HET9505665.1 serine hydrolase domain-containing protein [Hymenobacter sp.]